MKKLNFLFLIIIFSTSCSYKLGGLETIFENTSSNVFHIKESSITEFKQFLLNADVNVSSDKYNYSIEILNFKREKITISTTSKAKVNEYRIISSARLVIYNKEGNQILSKDVSFFKDHKFSSSAITSSVNEEKIITEEVDENLKINILSHLLSLN